MQAGAWKELMALISTHAATLISQSRNRLLEKWITALPEEVLKSDRLAELLAGFLPAASQSRGEPGLI